jgi:hypothetical protein
MLGEPKHNREDIINPSLEGVHNLLSKEVAFCVPHPACPMDACSIQSGMGAMVMAMRISGKANYSKGILEAGSGNFSPPGRYIQK